MDELSWEETSERNVKNLGKSFLKEKVRKEDALLRIDLGEKSLLEKGSRKDIEKRSLGKK